MKSLDYYATALGMIFGITKYFDQQEEKEKEINRIEQEKNEIRLKEIEQYKDSFRPSFILNTEGTKLLVIMKSKDLYIENVKYYASDSSDGIFYKSLRHNSEIDLKKSKNNYFITAETMTGEKIIFGVVLNGIKIYKSLNKDGSPIIPNDFTGKDISKKIDLNWSSFNKIKFFEDLENADKKYSLKEIDINFMYKTVAIREKMVLNLTEHMKEIIKVETVKNLFLITLSNISSNKREYENSIRKEIIVELKKILEENIDRITINPVKIKEDIWEYIDKKISLAKFSLEDKDIAALYMIRNYLDTNLYNIDNIISVFKMLIEKADFSEDINEKIEEYKVRILKCIED